jgi:deoxyribose-phosphate aldolase
MPLGSDGEVARLAITLLDLTDLGEPTTADAATTLCQRAREAGVAAVCVWPQFVALCAATLRDSGVRVATVVNFPSGDEPLGDVLAMTSAALVDGADEIDVVLPYRTWLAGDSHTAGDVLDGVRDLASSGSRLAAVKVIIESGELPDRAAVDRATLFAIAHGANFVKTSTGKTAISATLEAAEIILEAIHVSGQPVGFKASGGIRTLAAAREYLELAESTMGAGWISPSTFRFGASSLLDDLLTVA